MSTTKRRQRRAQQHVVPQAAPGSAPGPAAGTRPALPEWKWKTFPVYFAFWLGALIFFQLGLIAAEVGGGFYTLVGAGVALFLGFGVARFVVNWMMRHDWVKPRAKRR
ncbi:MAG: hypothetical protein WD557_06785 [Dehalococcoidia bacterium]